MASSFQTGSPDPSDNGGAEAAQDVATWFSREGSSVHEAYGVKTYYSADHSRFIPGSEPPVEHLKQLLVTFGSIPAPNQLATTESNQLDRCETSSLDLLSCSWEDVLDQLQAVKLGNPKLSKKTSRKADRFLASAAPYMQPWIELLPDEYGLGVIKGGLALLFAVSAAFRILTLSEYY
ncbi:hypothetical protein PG999_010838 [Apiospora kogelbergensis]|uniref:Uncharacterized protein n=1 Tax=Apiospora kogelbergensis TaxID=1337665 RepID=A0AAW0QDY3_9PEZI